MAPANAEQWVNELIDETTTQDEAQEQDAGGEASGAEPSTLGAEPGAGGAEDGVGTLDTREDDAPTGEPAAEAGSADDEAEPGDAGKQDLPGGLRYEIAKLRESRRELEAKVREQEEKLGKYDHLWTRLEELQAKAERSEKPKDPDPPSFDYDPTANLDHRARQVEADVAALKKQREEQEAAALEQTERSKRIEQGINRVRQQEQVFREHHADYDAALNHARSVLANQIDRQNRIWGRQASPEQIQAHIGRLELQTAFQALDAGLNPAEVAYKLATEQYGYKPGEVQPAVDDETRRLEEGLKASRGASTGAGKRLTKEVVDSTDNLPELEAALEELTQHWH